MKYGKWWMTYDSTLEGFEGPRAVDFSTWSDAIRSALNLSRRGYTASKPRVEAER